MQAFLRKASASNLIMNYRSFEMAKNEKTSSKVASIASKGLKSPGSLTNKEIKTIAATALTQAPDKKKR